MSFIAPSGKVREQMSQKNAYTKTSFIDDVFSFLPGESLEKLALSPPQKDTSAPATPPAGSKPGINEVMQQGNMRGNNIPTDTVPDVKPVLPNAKSVQPNGNPQNSNSPVSPFLSPDGEQNQQSDTSLLQEKQRIRQVLQGDFIIGLKRGKEGSFILTLVPPQGYKIPNSDQLVQAVMDAVQGEADDIGDPDPRSGAMNISYKSRNIGPQKVEKQ